MNRYGFHSSCFLVSFFLGLRQVYVCIGKPHFHTLKLANNTDLEVMMMADALIDIPSIRRVDKLENVQGRSHSTGKVIMPSGGLTILSRYLRASQGSCHVMCKYGTCFSPETEPKILRIPMRKIVAPKRGADRNLERVSVSNLGGRRKKSEISDKVSPDYKIQESDDPVVINIEQTQGHHLENVEEDLTDTNNFEVGVESSDDDPVVINIAQTQGHHLENVEDNLTDTKNSKVRVEPSNDDPVFINIVQTQGNHLENVEEDLTDTKNSKVGVEPSDNDPVVINIAQTQEHHLENVEEYLTDTKNSEVSVKPSNDGIQQSPECPAISVKPSCEDPDDIEATTTEGEAQYEENAETKSLRGEKLNSEQAKSANIFEMTSYLVESNPKSKRAESDQNNVVSIRPSSSSKDKSMNQNKNRTPIVQAPCPYEKKNMIYKPKGDHSGGFPPSLSSFPGRKSLRPTPNGLNITQPSLASWSISTSLMSSPIYTSAEHDKAVAEKQKVARK